MSSQRPTSPRYVIIDETDSSIDYSSGWTRIDGSTWDTQGIYGPTFGGRLVRASNDRQLEFSIPFDGSAGRVTGTVDMSGMRGQEPSWTCTLGGTATVEPQDPGAFPLASVVSNFDLCAWGPGGELTTPAGGNTANGMNITEGTHTISVTVMSGGNSFAFDRFMYIPSSTATLGVDRDDVILELGVWDGAVEYSTGWQDLPGMGRMAASMAAVRVRFYGSSISWIGSTPSDQPKAPGKAQWQLDGGSQNDFTVPAASGTTTRNTVFFQTPATTRGHHTLIVTNLGLTSTTPLVLTRLWIHGGAFPEPVRPAGTDSGNFNPTVGQNTTVAQNSTATALPSPSNAIISGSKSSVPIGPIVGGVVGGLALIVGALLALLWIRRKTSVEYTSHVESQQVAPFDGRPTGYPHPSRVQSDAPESDDDDAATQHTVVVSVHSEKERKRKKEKRRLTMRNQTDTSSIGTTDATSVKEKESITMTEVVPIPLVPNRLAPNRRKDETPVPPLPPAMPSIPEQHTYSTSPKKVFGIGKNRSKTPPATTADPLPLTTYDERHINPSTHPSPPSTIEGSTASGSAITITPLFRPNRRPVTGTPAPTQNEVPLAESRPEVIFRPSIAASKQRARTPSPPPMERHASVSTYSRPPSSISPFTGMRSLWRSNRRTVNSEATNGDDEEKHASVSTYHHPPSDVGGIIEDPQEMVVSGSSSGGPLRPNRRDTTNTLSRSTFSATPTLVEETLSEPSQTTGGNSGTLSPLRPVRHPALEANHPANTPTSPALTSAGLSKQEEVAREAEAVANFTTRFRTRHRTGNSSIMGDRGKRKKHKDAGVVLVPPIFTGSGSTSAPRALGSPPGYSPPPP